MALHFTSAQQLRRDHLQSLNSNEKKKKVPICSRWFGLLFILVLASDECPSVMSHQGCNICLAGFKDATPPTWLAAGNVAHRSGTVSGTNWEQGEKKRLRCKILLYLRGRLKIESHWFSS